MSKVKLMATCLLILVAIIACKPTGVHAEKTTYKLGPKETVVISSKKNNYFQSVSVKGGSHDFLYYYDKSDGTLGSYYEYGSKNSSYTYSKNKTEALIITNTSSNMITISGKDLEIVRRSNPALEKKVIKAGQTFEIRKYSDIWNFAIDTGKMKYDLASYDLQGNIYNYSIDTSGKFKIPKDSKVILTNRESKNTELITPYQSLDFTVRSAPALMRKTLAPGQSVEIHNNQKNASNVQISGVHDYALYEDDGSVASYQRKRKLRSISLSNANKLIITNTDSKNIEITGPNDGFSYTESETPACFDIDLSPGDSIDLVNYTKKVFSVYTKGTHDYVEYYKDGKVLAMKRKSTAASNSISAKGRMSITNSGTSSFSIAGPYHAFKVDRRDRPALAVKKISPGQSMEAANDQPDLTVPVYISGKSDQALYKKSDGIYSYSRSKIRGMLQLGPLKWVAVMNVSSSAYEVYAPYDLVGLSDRANPVTFEQILKSGESIDLVNVSKTYFRLGIRGTFDFANYNGKGKVISFKENAGTTSGITVSSGNRFAMTNVQNSSLTVTGPYDAFAISPRSNPALYKRSLSRNETAEIKNSSPESFQLPLQGTYDYARYNRDEEITSFNRDHTYSALALNSGYRIVVTNSVSDRVHMAAPYDAVKGTDRKEPALFICKLASDQSLEAVNKGTKPYPVKSTGKYDYSLFNSASEIYKYSADNSAGSVHVPGGDKVAVMNTDTGSKEVWGPYDPFIVSYRDNPVTFRKTLPPRTTFIANNTSTKSFDVTSDGFFDYVRRSMPGYDIEDYGRAHKAGSLSIQSQKSTILTNAQLWNQTFKGPYDAFDIIGRQNPALYVMKLEPDESMEAVNYGPKKFNVLLKGTHDYAYYDQDGDVSSYERLSHTSSAEVSASERIAIMNSGTQASEVSAPFDVFHLRKRSTPVTFKKKLSPEFTIELQNVSKRAFRIPVSGKFDQASYNELGHNRSYDRLSSAKDLYVDKKVRSVITNADVQAVEVTGPFDAFKISDRKQPALFIRQLGVNKNINIVNTSEKKHSVKIKGTYDYAEYDQADSILKYGHNQRDTVKDTNPDITLALMNTGTKSIEVSGPYDIYEVTDRKTPVSFIETLSPGQTVEALNHSSKIYSVYPTGAVDYVKYNQKMEQTYNQRKADLKSHVVLKEHKIVLTNADDQNITVTGSYDAFKFNKRDNPAFLVRKIVPGISIDIINTSSGASVAAFNSSYDCATYDAENRIEKYKQSKSASTEDIPAHNTLAAMNTGNQVLEIAAPYDITEMKDRPTPVTVMKGLGKGETIEIENTSKRIFLLEISGVFDYAAYKAQGYFNSYQRDAAARKAIMWPGARYVVTNNRPEKVMVSGPYDAYVVSERNNPAVLVKSILPGQSVDLQNINPSYIKLNIHGIFDSVVYNKSGQIASTDTSVSPKETDLSAGFRMLVTNADANGFEVEGPFDALRVLDAEQWFTKHIGQGQTIEAKNEAGTELDLAIDGTFDYVLYSQAGTKYGKDLPPGSLHLKSRERAVITNRTGAPVTVSGLKDGFSLRDQADPALAIQVLKPGENSKVKNKRSSAKFSIAGTFDYVQKRSDQDYSIFGHLQDSQEMTNHFQTIVTHAGSGNLEIWGPYAELEIENWKEPALAKLSLEPG
ncbi:hypothetical protein P7H20_13510 [Paenibacillus larvae]|nr:hypothetical protein [Paenibacillus larvae]MDT2275643.1 hypothetical protein [Paenibacillus larvae]